MLELTAIKKMAYSVEAIERAAKEMTVSTISNSKSSKCGSKLLCGSHLALFLRKMVSHE